VHGWRTHLNEKHGIKFSDTHFQHAAKVAEEASPRPIHSQRCPLCLCTLDNSRREYVTHVGKHMGSIALAALPRESDSEESSVATDTSAAQTRVVQEQHAKQKHSPPSRPNSSASNRSADIHRKNLQTGLRDVYEALMDLESECDSEYEEDDKGQDKRLIIGPFVELPPKKSFPDYYMIIRKQISVKMFKRKIKTNEYSSLGDLNRDIKLLCLTSKVYNEDGSMIYVDNKVIEVSSTYGFLDI
jgi:hypothetical protein